LLIKTNYTIHLFKLAIDENFIGSNSLKESTNIIQIYKSFPENMYKKVAKNHSVSTEKHTM